jgi:hypothetical protein
MYHMLRVTFRTWNPRVLFRATLVVATLCVLSLSIAGPIDAAGQPREIKPVDDTDQTVRAHLADLFGHLCDGSPGRASCGNSAPGSTPGPTIASRARETGLLPPTIVPPRRYTPPVSCITFAGSLAGRCSYALESGELTTDPDAGNAWMELTIWIRNLSAAPLSASPADFTLLNNVADSIFSTDAYSGIADNGYPQLLSGPATVAPGDQEMRLLFYLAFWPDPCSPSVHILETPSYAITFWVDAPPCN